MRSFSRYGKYIVVFLLLLFVVGLALLGTTRLATHAAGASGKPAATCGAWSVMSSGNTTTTTNNVLNSVAVISAINVWAVGSYVDSTTGFHQALTEQWTGTSWTIIAAAKLAPENSMSGVAAIPGTNKLWAVGGYFPTVGVEQTLIERWSGTKWNIIPSPNVGTANNHLSGITVISGNNAWAAGYYINTTTGFSQTLIEHWDGTSWSVIPSQNPGQASNVITAISAHANKVWVVGYSTNSSGGAEHTLAERWIGTSATWQVIPTPNGDAGNSVLNAVERVPNIDQMWAAGSDYRSGVQHTLIEHWDGRTWAVISSPSPTATAVSLTGIAALSSTSAWAVGYYTDSTSGLNQTLTEHWNGTAWSIVTSANPGSGNNAFYGVDRVPATTQAWAVGSYNSTGTPSQTLTESYC